MFLYEATYLLKDVICPYCNKHTLSADMNYPFMQFNPTDISKKCNSGVCMPHFQKMADQFNAYQTGQINEQELRNWLDMFRKDENSE